MVLEGGNKSARSFRIFCLFVASITQLSCSQLKTHIIFIRQITYKKIEFTLEIIILLLLI